MSAVTVTFVGSGDAFGSGGRLQTCIVVEAAGVKFSIDFGATSLVGLRRQNIAPNSINAVMLTHLHGDHCGGIPFLLLDAMLGSKREAPLTILGPTGTEAHLMRLQESLFPGSHVMEPRFKLEYKEILPNGKVDLDGLMVWAAEARHTRETNPLALRVHVGDKDIAYTGDGEITEGLRQLVDGVDLLVAESYFYDKRVKWHLNYPDIASFNAKRIVLTHMHENMLKQVENVSEECASDGYRIVV